nr:VOC family protein [Thalassobacillus sp. CUG 92003]
MSKAASFYQVVLGLEKLMDHGWIATYGLKDKANSQVSFASQGGSDTPVPDLSIEVDDLDEALRGMKEAGYPIEYGPVEEPWGVRRFYVRDPFGQLINILTHQ